MGTNVSRYVPLTDPRVTRVFGLLVAVPLGLVILDIFFSGHLPDSVISVLKLPFVILVYLPVAITGAIIYEPLRFPVLLDAIPLAAEITFVLTVLGFYYLLAFGLVNLASVVRMSSAK